MATTTYEFTYSVGDVLKVRATQTLVVVKRQTVPSVGSLGPPLSGSRERYLCTDLNGTGEHDYGVYELTTP